MKNVADIIKLTVVLTIVSLTAALAIAFTNSKTKDRILEQNQIAEKSALEQIMPQNSEITEMHCSTAGCPSQYWIAKMKIRRLMLLKSPAEDTLVISIIWLVLQKMVK